MNSKPTILIVDDDKGLVRLLEKALSREGLATAGANSGKEAVQWLARHRADLLLLDLKLPDMEGNEVIDKVAPTHHKTPFIIITGQGDERIAVDMMKRGAIDYVVKDREFLEFVPSVVQRALRQAENERKLAAAEEALRRENAFTSAVLDTSGALILVLDREGRIVRFNRACEQVTGYRFADVSGRAFWDIFLLPEEKDEARAVFDRLCSGKAAHKYENHWLTRNGEPRLISWSNTILKGQNDTVEFVIATGIDISEQKRLEKEILEISGREQRRIGQDLHDGICQHLAGTELMSQVLEQNLEKKSLPEAALAEKIAEHVREAISQTRMLARGLSPVEVESNGLMSALHELASNTEKLFRIACRFHCEHPVMIKDHNAATQLYRVAQEAATNAIKHGKATRILIQLNLTRDHAELIVRDNGISSPDMLQENKGMGLRIMKYRAGIIGATLEFLGNPKGGMTVRCRFKKSL